MVGIIIAGGFGTRLQPLTYARPKHVLPVANRPFLEYQIALLRHHGVADIVFATGYHADQIAAVFGSGEALGVRLAYAEEREPLGTGGAIRNAWDHAQGAPALVLNGDILTDFDLGALLAFHRARSAVATIALRKVGRPNPFGQLTVETDGRILAWNEPDQTAKRAASAAQPGPLEEGFDLINAGIYVLEPEALRAIPTGRSVSVERETYPALLAAGAGVYGMAPEGYWLDMGSPAAYLEANAAVLAGLVGTDVPYAAVAEGVRLSSEADIDGLTSLGPGCVIEAGARLSKCIMLGGVSVGANSRVCRAIAEERVAIGDDVTLEDAVLASGSVLSRGSRA